MSDTRENKLPRTKDEIATAAAAVGLCIPDACVAGVIANLALLDTHATCLFGDTESLPS